MRYTLISLLLLAACSPEPKKPVQTATATREAELDKLWRNSQLQMFSTCMEKELMPADQCAAAYSNPVRPSQRVEQPVQVQEIPPVDLSWLREPDQTNIYVGVDNENDNDVYMSQEQRQITRQLQYDFESRRR